MNHRRGRGIRGAGGRAPTAGMALAAGLVLAACLLLAPAEGELLSGYYTIVGEDGQVVLRTALRVSKGDVFIDPDDRSHRVVQVSGATARSVLELEGSSRAGQADPSRVAGDGGGPGGAGGANNAASRTTTPAGIVSAGSRGSWRSAVPLGAARQVIVIYHTHSDESYVPTDGVSSLPGAGGIYDVGETMAGALADFGFTVVHDREAHDPHDAGAYPRSRRTVLQNLRFGPRLLFDVHRDSAPVDEYSASIGGVPTAKILIVVGRGNPLSASNLGVSRQMKAVADNLYAGLVRGIYLARGSYNQDLDPGAILLEMGTDGSPKEEAQRAAALWGEVVSAYLGPPGPRQ